MLNLSQHQARTLALSVGIAATLYLIFIFLVGYEEILEATVRLGWSGWLFILGCSLTNYLLRFLRWSIYLKKLGYVIPHFLHFVYYMSGFALTTTPGKAGEMIRSFYLKRHGVNFSHSLAMFFTERFLDVVIITLLATLAVLSFGEYGRFVLVTAVILLLFLPLLSSGVIVHNLQRLTVVIRYKRLRLWILHLSTLLDSARSLLEWRILYNGMLLGLLAWAIQGVAFYYILVMMQSGIPWHLAMSIYAISLLAGALSFVPGGIGTTEATMGLLLINNGADPVMAIAVPLISRLSTLWFAVSLGLLSSLYLGIREDIITTDNST